jgi:hypothetical protein
MYGGLIFLPWGAEPPSSVILVSLTGRFAIMAGTLIVAAPTEALNLRSAKIPDHRFEFPTRKK